MTELNYIPEGIRQDFDPQRFRIVQSVESAGRVHGLQVERSALAEYTTRSQTEHDKTASTSERGDKLPEPAFERPCFQVHDDWFKLNDQTMRPGLYWHGWTNPRAKHAEPEPVDQWVCSPIHALAITHDECGGAFGLLLRFIDPNGRWHRWAAPLQMLSGSGEDLRGELLDQGVRIDPKCRNLLSQWLMNQYPKRRVLAAGRTGWHELEEGEGRRFVLPNRVIGGDEIIYQSEHAQVDDFIARRSLDDWKRTVAHYAPGNPLVLLALSAAFVGPLLKTAKLTEVGGVGLHLLGDSSSGKSSLLTAAGSVWGPPSFVRTWRATSNGLEGVAHALNDTLLPLDEIGEALPREVGSIVYAVANGVGKQRARRTGGPRPTLQWRVVMLSTGEKALAAHMEEAGQRAKQGQEARLLSVPVDGHNHGAFDQLHDAASGGALADQLREAASASYGSAGPAFVEALMSDDRDLPARYRKAAALRGFEASLGIESRAASVFALVGMAGELAQEYGIVSWTEGEAMKAAISAFHAWRDRRGAGHAESEDICRSIRDFIERHQDARFSAIHDTDKPVIRERAGYYEHDATGQRLWLLNTSALREAAAGYELKRILDAVEEAGWLGSTDTGKRSRRVRVDGTTHRFFPIKLVDEAP